MMVACGTATADMPIVSTHYPKKASLIAITIICINVGRVMLAADSFESSSECSEWTESKASPSLYSTSADEVSVMSAKSGALQELFSSLRIDQTSLDDEQPFTSKRQVFDDEFDRLFAISDAPENIALDGEGKIVAATIGKLVERLTIGAGTRPPHQCQRSRHLDTEFMEDFLISYRTFMSAQTLARMLSFRLKQGFLSIDDGKLGQSLKLRYAAPQDASQPMV